MCYIRLPLVRAFSFSIKKVTSCIAFYKIFEGILILKLGDINLTFDINSRRIIYFGKIKLNNLPNLSIFTHVI